MTESLRTKLVSLLTTAKVDVRLSEDETKAYPFVTYEMTVNPVRDKDGVCKYTGETYIRIVSDDFPEADTIRATVESAIETGMGYGQIYCSRLISTDKDCVNDVWTIELYYNLAQYGDEPIVPDGEEIPEGPAVPADSEPNNEEPAEEETQG